MNALHRLFNSTALATMAQWKEFANVDRTPYIPTNGPTQTIWYGDLIIFLRIGELCLNYC